jgi:hypothetical protein
MLQKVYIFETISVLRDGYVIGGRFLHRERQLAQK